MNGSNRRQSTTQIREYADSEFSPSVEKQYDEYPADHYPSLAPHRPRDQYKQTGHSKIMEPMTMKSISSQLTSVLKRIAIKGIVNAPAVASAIQMKTLLSKITS
ncbi:MAG: hypothetical protein ACR2QU_05050 [Gammaproteobacteria bacterium]